MYIEHICENYYALLSSVYMTTEEKLDYLIFQIAELPDEMQNELAKSIVEMRLQNLGISYMSEHDPDAPDA